MKIIMFLVSFVFVVSCSQGPSEADKLMAEARIKKTLEPREIQKTTSFGFPSPEWTTVSYYYAPGHFKVAATFKVYTNDHHPHGYVFIRAYEFGNEKVVTPYADADYYIDNIHVNPAFNNPGFRTAEALASSYLDFNSTEEASVARAGSLMIGRASGLSR